MSAVMQQAGDMPALFQRLRDKADLLAHSSAAARIERIEKLLKAILAARPAILEAAREELAVCDTDLDAQLLMVKGEAEFICKHLKSWMAPEKIQGSIMTLGKKSYLRYEPKGVVLHVSTWNAPIAEAFVIGFGALAAGCSFCLKPSELADKSAQVIADIVTSVLPEDEFAVVQGGPEAAQALLACPFNHIFYIGGHGVGRIIMQAAAEHFASVTLEMGGKNPALIDASADVEDAAKKIAWGRVANCGQVCLAPDYALVHESLERPFIAALGAAMTAMYNHDGKGFEHSPYLPRVINQRHCQRIKALVDDAVEKGATVELGGHADVEQRFVAPTILTAVNDSMKIMQEEIFGPVICILPFARREDAAAEIRKRPKPLSSYIFAKDRSAIDWFLAHSTSGSTVVNHNLIQSGTNPYLPFGGVNSSGIGRIGGHYTFKECSNARAVVEEGPPLMDPDMMFPPYDDKYRKMVGDMLSKRMNIPTTVINLINGIIALRGVFSRK